MKKNSNSTASSEEAVETTTNKVVAENVETISEEVLENDLVENSETFEEEVETSVDDKPEVTAKPTGKTSKVKILLPVAGKFLLPYNVGQVVKLTTAQATELVEAKYAEFVK